MLSENLECSILTESVSSKFAIAREPLHHDLSISEPMHVTWLLKYGSYFHMFAVERPAYKQMTMSPLASFCFLLFRYYQRLHLIHTPTVTKSFTASPTSRRSNSSLKKITSKSALNSNASPGSPKVPLFKARLYHHRH